MFLETVDQFAAVATAKAAFLRRSPFGFWLSAMMAGGYVALGIILIFCVGGNVDRSDLGHFRRLRSLYRPHDVHDLRLASGTDRLARSRCVLGRLLGGKSRGLRFSRRDLCGGRRWPRALWQKPADHQCRGRKDE